MGSPLAGPLSWGLYCLAVLFLLLYLICASVPTEGAQQTIAWHVTPLLPRHLRH